MSISSPVEGTLLTKDLTTETLPKLAVMIRWVNAEIVIGEWPEGSRALTGSR